MSENQCAVPRQELYVGPEATFICCHHERCGRESRRVYRHGFSRADEPGKSLGCHPAKVEQAVIDVGYAPHGLARNAKRGETQTILVIVPDICDPFFSEIIRGVEVTAAQEGYLVLIGDCAHQDQQEKPSST